MLISDIFDILFQFLFLPQSACCHPNGHSSASIVTLCNCTQYHQHSSDCIAVMRPTFPERPGSASVHGDRFGALPARAPLSAHTTTTNSSSSSSTRPVSGSTSAYGGAGPQLPPSSHNPYLTSGSLGLAIAGNTMRPQTATSASGAPPSRASTAGSTAAGYSVSSSASAARPSAHVQP